jgi:hypothetical protein
MATHLAPLSSKIILNATPLKADLHDRHKKNAEDIICKLTLSAIFPSDFLCPPRPL